MGDALPKWLKSFQFIAKYGREALKGVFKVQILKIFLSETARPRAFIFGVKDHLGDLHQVWSNHDPRGQIGPALGYNNFNIEIYSKILKNLLL